MRSLNSRIREFANSLRYLLFGQIGRDRGCDADNQFSLVSGRIFPFANMTGALRGVPPGFTDGCIEWFGNQVRMTGYDFSQCALGITRSRSGDTLKRPHRMLNCTCEVSVRAA